MLSPPYFRRDLNLRPGQSKCHLRVMSGAPRRGLQRSSMRPSADPRFFQSTHPSENQRFGPSPPPSVTCVTVPRRRKSYNASWIKRSLPSRLSQLPGLFEARFFLRPFGSRLRPLSSGSSGNSGMNLKKAPGNAEPDEVDPAAGEVPAVAGGGAHVPGFAVPGAAAQNTARAVAATPHTAVRWRAVIVFIIAIIDPLPNIAVHVVEAKTIGLETAGRGRSVAIAVIAALIAPIKIRALIGAVTINAKPALRIAETVFGAGPRPGRVLPFRLA